MADTTQEFDVKEEFASDDHVSNGINGNGDAAHQVFQSLFSKLIYHGRFTRPCRPIRVFCPRNSLFGTILFNVF